MNFNNSSSLSFQGTSVREAWLNGIQVYRFLPSVITWTGGGTDNNWSTPSNWSVRGAAQQNDFLIFAGSTRLTPFNNLTIDTPISGIGFASGASAFTISGNRFILNAGGITNNSSNTQTINNDIVLSTGVRNINCNTSAINLNGNISGNGSLTKLGTPTLSLCGNNSYTGNTFISAGIVEISNSNPFGTGVVYLSTNTSIGVLSSSIPDNTIINNSIFANGGTFISAQKPATINGLLTIGPTSVANNVNIDNNATLTFNGGISGLPTMGSFFRILGNVGSVKTGTLVLSSKPLIFDSASSSGIYADRASVNVVVAVSGNKFNGIRLGTTLRTDVPLAIDNDTVTLGFPRLGSTRLFGLLDLNGNDQRINRLTSNTTGTVFEDILANNIFNNSTTTTNLSVNNTSGNSTYTGSISGNINLIKTGSNTLTLSGSTSLGVGPRYTGFTAISAGTLTNYALSSNPSNKVNFASFTNTALTINFAISPIAGETYILLPGRTINSYPSVTLQNAAGRTGAYNSTNSTLTIS